ncbi:VQ motif-containing protein 1 [Manihot esculenta]|uniref:VQ domain-containing protein n=1 Tax=Manihot esculenta TaxID=3983 RepID=A0A2C9U5S4_MANES|nr:VQ motif-containing protein 1 [Manihot esculenta]OAY25144.1 hypothetical protein MANES_17G070600v8 [Manihot esculenta]
MASASSSSRKAIKVVIIDTQYVVTDPLAFKSVVQSLTGKDSGISWTEDQSSFAGEKRKREAAIGPIGGVAADGKLAKGLSFKDLDRMILEMPPAEEWHQFWAQNNLL